MIGVTLYDQCSTKSKSKEYESHFVSCALQIAETVFNPCLAE